jgi:hypothetical protein
MRSDMAKVVTERPRHGGHHSPNGTKSIKTGRKLSKDEFDSEDVGPSRHPISRKRQYGWNCKELSDLLGPLRKYLKKQVGRSWNDVYSELSQNLDRRSVAGLHIWSHVTSEVAINCFFAPDGKIHNRRYFFGGETHEVDGLYVHPTNGKLCFNKVKRVRYRWDPNEGQNPSVKLTATTKFERIDGIWYYVTSTPYEVKIWYGTASGQTIGVYKNEIRYKVTKRQLNTKELRAQKLVNIRFL